MKYKFFLLILILGCLLAADSEYSTSMSVLQISETTKMPVRKVIEYLEISSDTDIRQPVAEQGITADRIRQAVDSYKENKIHYYLGIVLVGMGTVFASLILVALIIAQLRYLDKKRKPRRVIIPKSEKDPVALTADDDVMAAITTTLYLYELELEENNRLLLTWKRTPVSMWKASKYIPMNEVDPSRRK